jgi:rod shape-determining protein MreC
MATPPGIFVRSREAPTAPLLRTGAPPRRTSPGGPPLRSRPAYRRRLAVGTLIVASLALMTISFRQGDAGALHAAQSAGASALRPVEVAIERVTQPFRDLYGWVDGLMTAKSENARLREELKLYKQQAIQSANALDQNEQLRRQLNFIGAKTYPRDYTFVAAEVIGGPPNEFDQQVTISAGARQGVRKYDPVVTPDGLVGQVDRVADQVARVKLLTDRSSAVSAKAYSGADGVIRSSEGTSDALSLDLVQKDEVVKRGDYVVTSGWRSGDLGSAYPKGLPIGVVTSVGRTDTDLYTQVLVEPYVDFSDLDAVLVLRNKNPVRP